MAVLPTLLSTFISATDRHKHTLYNQASSSSKSSYDVFIAENVRLTAAQGLQILQERVNRVSAHELQWDCRKRLWSRVTAWGGYLEDESCWTSLLIADARRAEVDLVGTDDHSPILETLTLLENLDHHSASVGPATVGWALAVSIFVKISSDARLRADFVRLLSLFSKHFADTLNCLGSRPSVLVRS